MDYTFYLVIASIGWTLVITAAMVGSVLVVTGRFDAVNNKLDDIKSGLHIVKTDVSTLKTDVSTLKTDVCIDTEKRIQHHEKRCWGVEKQQINSHRVEQKGGVPLLFCFFRFQNPCTVCCRATGCPQSPPPDNEPHN